jgi:pyruvate-formate lyase-activating enzyme
MLWKVCPVQGRQLLDVKSKDIYGDFRFCDTGHAGGGYDRFPAIRYKRRPGLLHYGDITKQLVVQLHGCPLRCPYCYVTRDGIYGRVSRYTSEEIVTTFCRAREIHGVGTLHLMGGAPGLYLDMWYDIVKRLPWNASFTSDLLLIEQTYKMETLRKLAVTPVTIAVNIKGVTSEDWARNTGTVLNEAMFWNNFERVVNSGIDFYLTFTNPDTRYYDSFLDKVLERFGKEALADRQVIDLKEYNAIKEKGAWE